MNNDVTVTVQHDGFEPAQVRVYMNADGKVRAYMSFSSRDTALLGQGTALPEPKTYHIGQRFKFNDGHCYTEYMLASVCLDTVILTNTEFGSRWCNSVRVSNPAKITEEELKSMIGDKFLYFSEVTE